MDTQSEIIVYLNKCSEPKLIRLSQMSEFSILKYLTEETKGQVAPTSDKRQSINNNFYHLSEAQTRNAGMSSPHTRPQQSQVYSASQANPQKHQSHASPGYNSYDKPQSPSYPPHPPPQRATLPTPHSIFPPPLPNPLFLWGAFPYTHFRAPGPLDQLDSRLSLETKKIPTHLFLLHISSPTIILSHSYSSFFFTNQSPRHPPKHITIKPELYLTA